MGPKRVKKGHFWPFFDFLACWFALKSFNNFKPPSCMTHVSGISTPNLQMIQLTLLYWLLVELGKVLFYYLSAKKHRQTTSHFLHVLVAGKFPPLVRYNRVKFVEDSKRSFRSMLLSCHVHGQFS